jgi:hypothetical protein
MSLAELLPYLLVIQAVMGGIDTLVNHELLEKLPQRLSARREIGLHSVREATYGALFVGLGWFAWHGTFALVIAALLLLEIAVTATDELVENRTRVLPQNERVLHVFLTLNYGFIVALLIPVLLDWGAQPAGLQPVHHGWTSWALAIFGLSSFAWALRDLLAWRRLARAAPSEGPAAA